MLQQYKCFLSLCLKSGLKITSESHRKEPSSCERVKSNDSIYDTPDALCVARLAEAFQLGITDIEWVQNSSLFLRLRKS